MDIKDYNYTLPESLIAHHPAAKRDDSKLMVIKKQENAISHHRFSDIAEFLDKNDMLILNNTKVRKARLHAQKSTGGKVEIFLLTPQSDNTWEVLIKPTKKVKENDTLTLTSELKCTILKKHFREGSHLVKFEGKGDIKEALEAVGSLPLPPYITPTQDTKTLEERYQTVYAQKTGAVAAPTAGLHFTQDLLNTLKNNGINIQYITLHVGYGTFKPIATDDITQHELHYESYELQPETSQALTQAKKQNKRFIAVGTTVTRTLEAAYTNNQFQIGSHQTNLYIYPGYTFNAINGLLTNFHLPKTSLLVLVSAFAGTELIKEAYKQAVDNEYRFYSFGDAMLILP